MQDPLIQVESLAAEARREQAPRVEASRPVVARLRSTRRRDDGPMAVLALASAAVAIVVIAASTAARATGPDPLESMIDVASVLGL